MCTCSSSCSFSLLLLQSLWRMCTTTPTSSSCSSLWRRVWRRMLFSSCANYCKLSRLWLWLW
ncbi:hypothetical protein Mgra_00008209 [Meloidogyne graminicola]|uniref:Secreted protein n=1 Tax=Meloidogyne graminicola TaxID=189291 RepID=A0A8S9ZGH9_9BILA|nr:hypothetical protein Mgra_00008209 [Meloidogyne graminicola]